MNCHDLGIWQAKTGRRNMQRMRFVRFARKNVNNQFGYLLGHSTQKAESQASKF